MSFFQLKSTAAQLNDYSLIEMFSILAFLGLEFVHSGPQEPYSLSMHAKLNRS